jgi:thiol:disulfide interchange protein
MIIKPFKINLFLLKLVIPFLLLNSWAFVYAQEFIPEEYKNIVQFEVEMVPGTIHLGEFPRLEITAKIKKKWHIYSVLPQGEDSPPPTLIKIKTSDLNINGPIYESRPIFNFDKAIGINLSYHERSARFYQNFDPLQKAVPGKKQIETAIKYQACDDRICLPPKTITISSQFETTSAAPRPEYLFAPRDIDNLASYKGSSQLDEMLAEGIWGFILLAVMMGLASLLTPCVFPMVPITVSYFSKVAEGNPYRLVKLAVIFCLGIIGTYTGLGIITTIIFGAGAALQLASNPIVNLVIAAFFILFAFSLFGFFTINLPSGIVNYFDQKSRSYSGIFSVLLMGFTFTLTAFTCTVQFVGTMLIAATQGEWLWPIIGMLVFSTVFAIPFFILALLPKLIIKLKGSSGIWLVRTKVILGVLELMASIKFLSNADLVWGTELLSRDIAIYTWTVLLGIGVLYLLQASFKTKHNKSQWFFTIVLGITLAFVFNGRNDKSLGSLIDAVLPPVQHIVSAGENLISETESKELIWVDSLEEAMQLAQRDNKKILLEFTGYTCVNCRWMEQNILANRDVHELIKKRFIAVRLFTDGGQDAEKNLKLQIDRFQTIALPYYATLTENGRVQNTTSGVIYQFEEFINFLENIVQKTK